MHAAHVCFKLFGQATPSALLNFYLEISNVQHKETVRGKSTFSFSTTLMGRLVQEFRRLCGVKGVGLKRSGKETEEKMGVNVEGRPGVNASYPVGKL